MKSNDEDGDGLSSMLPLMMLGGQGGLGFGNAANSLSGMFGSACHCGCAKPDAAPVADPPANG